MELTYLLIWIAGGGLVTLAIYTCFCLLECRSVSRRSMQLRSKSISLT